MRSDSFPTMGTEFPLEMTLVLCMRVCACASIISTAVKCFDDVKMNIRQRCRHEGAQIYHVHYIQPLVERTRDTVLTRCTLSAPYSAYFLQAVSSSAASLSIRPFFICIFVAAFAAVFFVTN